MDIKQNAIHLVGSTCFLTFTTVIYILLGIYGLRQYECVDVYTNKRNYESNISGLIDCSLCSRNVFSSFITSETSDIENISVLATILINWCCVLIGILYMWCGNFRDKFKMRMSVHTTLISV